jgi:uncharacterized RmlC-like cupin family protein
VERVSAIAGDRLIEGDATPGLVREVAFTTDGAVLLRTRAEGGVISSWHHHGNREVFGHILRGQARFEFGPGGREHTHVPEGGFFHIPGGLVHRDVNPVDEAQEMVISFVGSGPLVENVDGPEPG